MRPRRHWRKVAFGLIRDVSIHLIRIPQLFTKVNEARGAKDTLGILFWGVMHKRFGVITSWDFCYDLKSLLSNVEQFKPLRFIESCLLHHLRLPTHLSTPIFSQGRYFGELTRSYRTEDMSTTIFPLRARSEHPPSNAEHLTIDCLTYRFVSRLCGTIDVDEDRRRTKEDHSDYLADGGDDDDELSDDDDDDDDTDNEGEEPFKDEYDDKEEEEHLVLADSFVVPVVNFVPSAGDTKAFETDESAPTPRSPQIRIPFAQTRLRRARKTVRLKPPMSPSMEARIAEYAAAPALPSPPPSLLSPWYEVGESLTVAPRPTRGHRADYRFIGTMDAEIRHRSTKEVGYGIRDVWVDPTEAVEEVAPTTLKGVNARVIDLAAVQEQDTQDVYNNMPPRRSSATARAAAATAAAATPMTVAAVEQLIEARVSAALANHETL
ncbi:hypothetical protein Tco_1378691 [Tanacetum coccineum]